MDIIDCGNRVKNGAHNTNHEAHSTNHNEEIDALFKEAVNESTVYTDRVVQHALLNTVNNNQSQIPRWLYNAVFDSSPENYLKK